MGYVEVGWQKVILSNGEAIIQALGAFTLMGDSSQCYSCEPLGCKKILERSVPDE